MAGRPATKDDIKVGSIIYWDEYSQKYPKTIEQILPLVPDYKAPINNLNAVIAPDKDGNPSFKLSFKGIVWNIICYVKPDGTIVAFSADGRSIKEPVFVMPNTGGRRNRRKTKKARKNRRRHSRRN